MERAFMNKYDQIVNTKYNLAIISLGVLVFVTFSNNNCGLTISRLMLEKNSKNNQRFITAARHGQTDKVKSLLAQKTDINSTDIHGRTALMYATENRHTNTVKLLVTRGADINSIDNYGNSALELAAKYNRVNILNTLLKHRASISKT